MLISALMPPMPDWDALHPLVIHFPIALFMVSPVFVALAIVFPKKAPWFGTSALILLALGTISAFVAVETGEAAAELATGTPTVDVVIKQHQELAEATRNVFAALTVLGAVLLALPLVAKKLAHPRFAQASGIVFLLLLLGGNVLLVNAAHLGGRLVHEFGVRAMIAPATQE